MLLKEIILGKYNARTEILHYRCQRHTHNCKNIKFFNQNEQMPLHINGSTLENYWNQTKHSVEQ